MTIFESFSFRAEISEGHAKCTQDRLRGHRTQKGLDGRNVYRKKSLYFLTASLRVWGGGENAQSGSSFISQSAILGSGKELPNRSPERHWAGFG